MQFKSNVLKYVDFLRDVGRHFSVNRMLSFDSVKLRLDREQPLTFLEFNYMILQAYDFLHLYREKSCTLQMGGNDQWGNILAGTDLIRRVEGGDAEALTFPLLTTASGGKMGKTEKGAIWLDAQRTSPYDYYQYWINTDDRDVGRFLALFTLLPMDEVRRLSSLEGAEIREAKEVLAKECTAILHGDEAAAEARVASKALFSAGGAPAGDAVPTVDFELAKLGEGVPVFVLFSEAGLVKSRGEARRLIKQGGAYVNGRRMEQFDEMITADDIEDGFVLLRAGKKKYMRLLPV